MEQNLIKEAIHLHLLSALSDAGVLGHVVFQGGTALRLCYGGERYSEDLDFVCGKSGAYVDDIRFDQLVALALETTKQSLQRDFSIDPDQIVLETPANPAGLKSDTVSVAAWQIIVPVNPTPRSPKSRVKIEFANIPAYDRVPAVAKTVQGLAQVQDVILATESVNEILADKAVALTARQVLKYRDVWDAWYLCNRLDAQADRNLVAQKFVDYRTENVRERAAQRRAELMKDATARPFLDEMGRFLPVKRIKEIQDAGLHRVMLAASSDLIKQTVFEEESRAPIANNARLLLPHVVVVHESWAVMPPSVQVQAIFW